MSERERVAAMLYESWPERIGPPWPETMERKREGWLAMADAILQDTASDWTYEYREMQHARERDAETIARLTVQRDAGRKVLAAVAFVLAGNVDADAQLAADRVVARVEALRTFLMQYVDWIGCVPGLHVEHCPEDDTCACAPVAELNALLGSAPARSPDPTAGSGHAPAAPGEAESRAGGRDA